MAKVMLVEDDNNLREIYEARLAAEGYEIISAADGEAALALAIKEKPDLIISDIMMPKVSGFDMLDILRSTTETKNAKIIMMTALNQAEDKAKAEQLGADLYLVKSQVTLEDVVKAAQQMLGDQNPSSVGGIPVEHPVTPSVTPPTATSLTNNTQAVPIANSPTTTPQIVQPAPVPPQPAAQPAPDPTPPAGAAQSATEPPSTMVTTPPSTASNDPATAALPEDKPAGEQIIVKNNAAAVAAGSEAYIDPSISGRKKVIQPISDVITNGPNINELLEEEKAAVPAPQPAANSVITPEGVTMPATPPNVAQPTQSTPAGSPPATSPDPSTPQTPVIAPQQPDKFTPDPNQQPVNMTAPNSSMPETSTTAEEEAALQAQIEEFITQNPTVSTTTNGTQANPGQEISAVPTPQQASAPATPQQPPNNPQTTPPTSS